MKDQPLVSVILPTWNRLSFLAKALDSVLVQTYPYLECLVVNDHPPTAAAVEALVASHGDERLKTLCHAENKGLATARNTGLNAAAGQLICFLDDDDLWLPEFLAAHVAWHEAHPEVGLLYSDVVEFWEDGRFPDRVVRTPLPEGDIRAAILSGKLLLPSGSMVSIKTEVLEGLRFDESLSSFIDWDLQIQLAARTRFGHLPEPLVKYRQHLSSRLSVDITHRMKGVRGISAKWGNTPEFAIFHRQIKANSYLNEIRNLTLRGRQRDGARLLLRFLRDCRYELTRHLRKIGLSFLMVLLGEHYVTLINLKRKLN